MTVLLAFLAAAVLLCCCACGQTQAGGQTEPVSVSDGTEPAPEQTEAPGPDGFVTGTHGETDIVDGKYVFTKDFTVDVQYDKGDFNRWTLCYDSSAPLRGKIRYTYRMVSSETEREEEFFLESGSGKEFSCLTYCFADGLSAVRVTGFCFESANGSKARLALRELRTETVGAVRGTEYMENDRYKVGVLLSWGGGISYIEDKNDGDPSITNLINRCDTGRLIQQSYYGVGNGPDYTSATYNGTTWNYNPVQGGDQYGNASRIIDYRRSEDGTTIYVKAQPKDWAQKNSSCPAYMENTYTLLEDGIRVENRFVDFYGVTHPSCHQELPAFYVISHLGTFHYYGGTKPWTGDAWRTLPDEPFWGGNSACYHNMGAVNTETWAAWTNTDGWGIGLYVPGTEIMLAGRFSYNGSKSPQDGATNYVAPLRTMNIVSFRPFEYSYVITTGTVEQMRSVFEKFR